MTKKYNPIFESSASMQLTYRVHIWMCALFFVLPLSSFAIFGQLFSDGHKEAISGAITMVIISFLLGCYFFRTIFLALKKGRPLDVKLIELYRETQEPKWYRPPSMAYDGLVFSGITLFIISAYITGWSGMVGLYELNLPKAPGWAWGAGKALGIIGIVFYTVPLCMHSLKLVRSWD